MDDKIVSTAQNWLTIDQGHSELKLVDLTMIMHSHSTDKVIQFLGYLCQDYDRDLKRHIRKDKTDPRINDIVARRFRVKMAMRTMQNAMTRKAA
ncbi:hypothetical protein SAMN02745216_02139 [Desulfatibacillum alkenivorans DSM 16219]|jgi:hypothetical protein|uniref:Transposase n=1 Tax=Desulfatibacillum alkenivorans DSM 16219 TaxID=1121393 RepID=A0A1M6LNR2_9BACT|nr:hypothetical protein [Desulfatibacillum alkenivorans]SHJ72844.1 hypothetical protein SAMN02745216_02139 [Desulfatibacillum alkenivorans DSM 16219]